MGRLSQCSRKLTYAEAKRTEFYRAEFSTCTVRKWLFRTYLKFCTIDKVTNNRIFTLTNARTAASYNIWTIAATVLHLSLTSQWAARDPNRISQFSFSKISFVGSHWKLLENTTRQSPCGYAIDLAISVQSILTRVQSSKTIFFTDSITAPWGSRL